MLRFTTQAGECAPFLGGFQGASRGRSTHTSGSYRRGISLFVSALIYGPFVYSCVHVRILFEQSAYLASRFCYFAPQCNTLRSPAFRILCALKSQFRRDLPGSKNLRTHYKRI